MLRLQTSLALFLLLLGAQVADARETVNFDFGWRYYLGDPSQGQCPSIEKGGKFSQPTFISSPPLDTICCSLTPLLLFSSLVSISVRLLLGLTFRANSKLRHWRYDVVRRHIA